MSEGCGVYELSEKVDGQTCHAIASVSTEMSAIFLSLLSIGRFSAFDVTAVDRILPACRPKRFTTLTSGIIENKLPRCDLLMSPMTFLCQIVVSLLHKLFVLIYRFIADKTLHHKSGVTALRYLICFWGVFVGNHCGLPGNSVIEEIP